MTEQEKQLLLQDLSARLSYGVICKMWGSKEENALEAKFTASDYASLESNSPYSLEYCKPYLRPMSSMTDKERETFNYLCESRYIYSSNISGRNYDYYDWLISNHFDYRDLIGKGLALEAPEGMYKID